MNRSRKTGQEATGIITKFKQEIMKIRIKVTAMEEVRSSGRLDIFKDSASRIGSWIPPEMR